MMTPCLCQPPVYVRTSQSLTLVGNETHVECDTDAGLFLVVTLPAKPRHMQYLDIWLGAQPGSDMGIDTNGKAVHGSDVMLLSSPNEGRHLVWIQPDPNAGGYWRSSYF